MAEEKKDAHAAGHAAPAASGGGIDIKWISKFVIWTVLGFLVIVFALIIVVFNPDSAQNFIYFLYGLDVIFGCIIIFCFYKLQDFRKRFLAYCHDVDHLYADKNGQGHGHDDHDHDHDHEHGHDNHHHEKDQTNKFLEKTPENIIEEKFQRAMKNVMSLHREEWRLGLLELEKVLKDLLLSKNYQGETLDEMLQTAKEAGFSNFDNAETAVRTRKFLARNLTELPKTSDHKMYKDVATLYKLSINELLE